MTETITLEQGGIGELPSCGSFAISILCEL